MLHKDVRGSRPIPRRLPSRTPTLAPLSPRAGHERGGFVVEPLEGRCLLSVTTLTTPLVPFQRVVVDQNPGRVPLEKTLADIQGNGELDVVVGHDTGNGGAGGIEWYQYPKSGVVTDHWNEYTIAVPGGSSYEDMTPYDLEGNGVVDIIASYNNQLVWFENPRNTGGNPTAGPWTMHVIGPDAGHEIVLGDFDGDGKIDIATRTHIYFQNSTTNWTTISTADYGNHNEVGLSLFNSGSPAGDVDLAGPSPDGQHLGWYENPRDHGGIARTNVWTFHAIASNYSTDTSIGICFASLDVNGDGMQDIITCDGEAGDTSGYPGGMIWWQAPTDRVHGPWIKHTIDSTLQYVHRITLGDMNNDGRTDIVFSEQEQSDKSRVGILFNTDGTGINWDEEVISTESGHNQTIGDVNGDGNLDILNVPHGVYKGVEPVVLFINKLASNVAPDITQQPRSLTTAEGASATLQAVVLGAQPVQYQWQRDGGVIPGATSAYYTIAAAQPDDAAQYDLVATNSAGTVTSRMVTLSLTGPTPPASLRATAADGKVSLSWASSADAATYNIYRGTTPGDEGTTPLKSRITGTSYSDPHISNGTTYYYTVTAVSQSSQEGGFSTQAVATPGNRPIVDLGGTVILHQPNGKLNETESFSDNEAGPYSATIDYGDGTGTHALALQKDGSFLLKHDYSTNFNRRYRVTVSVTDGKTSGEASLLVYTRDDPPHNLVVTPTNGSGANGLFSANVHFSDLGAGNGDRFRIVTDFGDGTGEQVITTKHRSLTIEHQYAVEGSYTVTTSVFDRESRSTSGSTTAVVSGKVGHLSLLSSLDVSDAGDDAFDGAGFFAQDASESSSGGIHPALTIGSTIYVSGLGVRASADPESNLIYDLGGKYATFQSDIGLDAAAGAHAAVRFRVYADGTRIYDSGKVTAASGIHSLNLSMKGVQTLQLLVTPVGTDAGLDFADWAGARLIAR